MEVVHTPNGQFMFSLIGDDGEVIDRSDRRRVLVAQMEDLMKPKGEPSRKLGRRKTKSKNSEEE